MYQKLKKMILTQNNSANQEAKKIQLIAASIIMFIFLCGFLLFVYTKRHKEATESNSKIALAGILDEKFNSSTDEALIEKQNRRIEKFKDEISKLREKSKKDIAGQAESFKGASNTLSQTISALKKRLDDVESENRKSKLLIATLQNNSAEDNAPSETANNSDANILLPNHINYQTSRLKHVSLIKKRKYIKQRTEKNYVWAGTRVEGFLLTGILGDAGINGTKNSGSGIIRFVDNGEMPNHKKSRLKDCTVTYSSYGDLSSSTAVLHLDTLSCAGNINLEKRVFGSVYDSDAMQDLRGTAILNSKPMVNYSVAAGMIAGLGGGLSSAGTVSTLTPNGNVSTANIGLGSILKQGAGGGISNGAAKASDYIMRIADIYHPVVAVKPGRRVTVVFLKGFWTDDQKPTPQKEQFNSEEHYSQVKSPVKPVSNNKSLDELIKQNINAQPLVKGA